MVVVTGDQGVLAGPATRGSPPQVVLIAAVWVVGLILTQQAGRSLPSTRDGEAPDSQAKARGHSQKVRAATANDSGMSTTKAALIFGAAAAATLVAGALAEESGTAAAGDVGLSGDHDSLIWPHRDGADSSQRRNTAWL